MSGHQGNNRSSNQTNETSNQLQLQLQWPMPPDRTRQLEQTIQDTRATVTGVMKLLSDPIDESLITALIESLTSAMRKIDVQVNDLETLSQYVNADNEELKMVAGKLRKQRDEAIKARNQVLAYLRQRRKKG